MSDGKIPLISIMGPTASGKTAFSVLLAKRLDGEVVSADSMQIYRGMDIATAKPTKAEQQEVPHHLIGFLDPLEEFSVADYVKLAHQAIADIYNRGKFPLLVGGTGLYLNAVLDNLVFTEIETDSAIRAKLEQELAENGPNILFEELMRIDPETASRLHPNNRTRLVRALEVYRLTGIPMSEHQRRSRLAPSPYAAVRIGLGFRNRQTLYDRIDKRVDNMMEEGLLEEARDVLNSKSGKTARQAIGYKELLPYFMGEATLEDAVDKIKQETRHYAKRQLTWFRRSKDIHWLMYEDYHNMEEMADHLIAIVQNLI